MVLEKVISELKMRFSQWKNFSKETKRIFQKKRFKNVPFITEKLPKYDNYTNATLSYINLRMPKTQIHSLVFDADQEKHK